MVHVTNIVGSKIQADDHHSQGMEVNRKSGAGIPSGLTGLNPFTDDETGSGSLVASKWCHWYLNSRLSDTDSWGFIPSLNLRI